MRGTPRIDISNKRFWFFTALRYIPKAGWECQCVCGALRVIKYADLRVGKHKSCGCKKSELTSAGVRTHGLSKAPEYNVWTNMRRRCSPEASPADRAIYYERGVTVCDEWAAFQQFYADMGPRPSKRYSLDRKDSTKGYSADNCRWATPDIQAHNSRVTKLTIDEVRAIQNDWRPVRAIAEQYGISRGHVVKVRSKTHYPRST
jgi:hypothetical protein